MGVTVLPTVQSIALNFVRALSLASIISVILSTIVDMHINVKAMNAFGRHQAQFSLVDCEYIEGSSVPNQLGGVFWAFMASLLIILELIILALSEVGWNTDFFDRYFPVLGSNFGLGILGLFQCLISIQILSHFVEDFTLISAFVLFLIGCLNILVGLMFRESARAKRSISPWRARVQNVLPPSQGFNSTFAVFSSRRPGGEITPYTTGMPMRQNTTSSDKSWGSTEKAGDGFGRREEKPVALGGPVLQKPEKKYVGTGTAPRPVSPPTFRSSPTAI